MLLKYLRKKPALKLLKILLRQLSDFRHHIVQPPNPKIALQTLQEKRSLTQGFAYLEQNFNNLTVYKGSTLKALQILSKSSPDSPNQILIQKLFKRLLEWGDNPEYLFQLWLIAQNLEGRANTKYRSREIERMFRPYKQKMVENLLKKNVPTELCRYAVAQAKANAINIEIIRRLEEKIDSLTSKQCLSLLNSFTKLHPLQRTLIFNLCQKICSNLSVESLDPHGRSVLYLALSDLDLERNSYYRRPVRVLEELAEKTEIPQGTLVSELEKILSNHIKGNGFRRPKDRIFVVVPDRDDYSEVFARNVLLAKKQMPADIGLSKSLEEKLMKILQASLQKEESINNLLKAVDLFGSKAVPYLKKNILNGEVHQQAIKLIIDFDPQGTKQVFQHGFKNLSLKNTNNLSVLKSFCILLEIYFKHIKKYPSQQTPSHHFAQQQIKSRLDNLWDLSVSQKRFFIDQFLQYLMNTEVPFLQQIEKPILNLYSELKNSPKSLLSFADCLDIMFHARGVSIENVDKFGDFNNVLNEQDYKRFKTHYNMLQNNFKTPKLFQMLWKKWLHNLPPKQKIFFILATPQQTIKNCDIGNQMVLPVETDLQKNKIQVRFLRLLDYYTNQALDRPSLTHTIEYNFLNCKQFCRETPYRTILSGFSQTLLFYLPRIKTMPQNILPTVTFFLKTALTPNPPSPSWWSPLVIKLVLAAYQHPQLHPTLESCRKEIQQAIKQCSLRYITQSFLNRKVVKSVKRVLKMEQLGYKLEFAVELKVKLQQWQGKLGKLD